MASIFLEQTPQGIVRPSPVWKRALALRKFFSTLLKTPNPEASILGNNFTDHKTAIHTCSQCSHNHFLQLQLKTTPAPHRISQRFVSCISHIIELEVELGQDRVDLQRLRDRLGTIATNGVGPEVH
jgi:hypothetical protein